MLLTSYKYLNAPAIQAPPIRLFLTVIIFLSLRLLLAVSRVVWILKLALNYIHCNQILLFSAMAEEAIVDAGLHYVPITATGSYEIHTEPSRPSSAHLSPSHSTLSAHHSSKEQTRDPNLDVNLPYRTLSADADLREYTEEKADGVIPGPIQPDGKNDYKLVTFTPGDPENPKNWSKACMFESHCFSISPY